jgi:hypothetical protein
MPSVEQILRESGFTDDQIRNLEPRAITAFGGVLTAAETERREASAAREQAELARRSNADFYENTIAPSLNNWGDEKARLDAELAYYKTRSQSLTDSGFVPPESQSPPRDNGGRYVANAPGGVPGSPQYFDVNKVYERAGDAVGILTDIQWEHQKLFGQPLPISPTELVRRADAVKLDPATYAARTFNWDQRRQQMQQDEQKAHDDKIRADATADADRKWAERVGSNPDVRLPQASRYADVARAVKAGTMPDPLGLNEEQRRQATRAAIRADVAERER